MASPDFDHAKVLYTPQLDRKTEGLLTLYLINPILIRVPGGTYFDSSDELAEVDRQDKDMVERWKSEADSVLVFVCAGSTILCIFHSKEHTQGWSVLSSWRGLRCRKLQVATSRFRR